MAKKKKQNGLLVLMSGSDGHTRITNGPGYHVHGGTAECHERMQEVAAKFNEGLAKAKKSPGELSPSEFRDIVEKANR